MFIHRISAGWRNQPQDALELREGLNLIEERGAVEKPDWPAVIRAALYGPDERDADLTRTEMDCQAHGRRVILSRGMEADAPNFQAADENGNAVEELTAENAGETLTGVSREAYERIACVVTDAPSGENAEAVREIQSRIDRTQSRIEELEQREAVLNQELRDMDKRRAIENLPDLSVLTAAYAAMKNKLEADNVPELDSISRLRGAIINIMTAGKQLDKAEAEQEAAEKVLAAAKSDVDAMPFAGMTPEEAEQSALKLPFKPFIPKWLAIVFGIAVVIGAAFLFESPAAWYPFAWIAFVALGVFAGWLVKRLGERWEVTAARKREQWEVDLVRYAELYRVMEEAQAAADIKIAAADTLRESLSTNERGILREIHRFAPEVSSMSEADAQLRLCAKRRKELAIAESVVRKAQELEAERGASMAIPAVSVAKRPIAEAQEEITEPKRNQKEPDGDAQEGMSDGETQEGMSDGDAQEGAPEAESERNQDAPDEEAEAERNQGAPDEEAQTETSVEESDPARSQEARNVESRPETGRNATSQEREKLIRALNAVREEREALRLEIRRDRKELAERSRAAEAELNRVPVSMRDRALLSLLALKERENLPDDAFPKELAPRAVEIFHALTDAQHSERKIFTPGRISSLFAGAEGSSLRKFLEARGILDLFYFAVCLASFERGLSGDERPPLILRGLPSGLDERCRAASVRFLESMAENGQILLFAADSPA